jgi:hypothetical protein
VTSTAETPASSLKGLRVYEADRLAAWHEVAPPPSPRRYWTRKGIANWLVAKLSEEQPTLVGIDHGFSFPLQYFEQHGLRLDWPSFLDDFQRHWPTDEDIYVARTAFLVVALLLAQGNVLDYLVAVLLKQAEALNILPTKSLLFKDMAFEIEAVMREQNEDKR